MARLFRGAPDAMPKKIALRRPIRFTLDMLKQELSP